MFIHGLHQAPQAKPIVELSLLLISVDFVEAPQAPYIFHGGVTSWS